MDLAEFSNAVRPLGSRGWTPASGHRQSARSCRAGPLPAKPSRARRVSPLHRREAGNSKHPGPMEPLGLACRLACKTKNGPLRPVFACLLAGRRDREERWKASIDETFLWVRRSSCPQPCPQDDGWLLYVPRRTHESDSLSIRQDRCSPKVENIQLGLDPGRADHEHAPCAQISSLTPLVDVMTSRDARAILKVKL